MTAPKSSKRYRLAIPIIVALIAAIGTIIAAAINIIPKFLPSKSTNVTLTVHVADKSSISTISGAKVTLLVSGHTETYSGYSDGNGIAFFSLGQLAKSEGRLFIESDKYQIFDQIVELASDQSVDIRLTPKDNNDHSIVVRVVDDSNNQPVDGANVVLLTGGDTQSQSTDSNGIAKFHLTFSGDNIESDITVSNQDFKINRQRVTIKPDEIQDVRLNRSTNELSVTNFTQTSKPPSSGSGDGSIEFGIPVYGEFTQPLQLDKYIFNANANDVVLIRVAPAEGSTVCAEVKIYGPDGAQITTNSAISCTVSDLTVTLPTDGKHTIIASIYNRTGLGKYNLVIQKVH